MANAGTDAAHALHCQGEVDFDGGRWPCPVGLGVAHLGIQARCANQGLQRHCTVVQRETAQQVLFNQCHPGAKRRRSAGGHQPGWPGADDEQVVGLARFRVAPVGRAAIESAFGVIGIGVCWVGQRIGLAHGNIR